MDEKELADRLNNDIHIILDQQPRAMHKAAREIAEREYTAGEYQEMLEIARRLAHSDMSSQSRVRGALKQRLLNRLRNRDLQEAWSFNPFERNRTMQPKLRPIPFVLAALIVLGAAFALTPTGRAFAQNVWQQVGPLIIVNRTAPTPEPALTGATPTPLPGSGSVPAPLPPLAGPTPGPGEGTGRDLAVDPSASPTPLPVSDQYQPLSDQMALDKYGFQVLQPRHMPEEYSLTEHQVTRTLDGRIVSISVYTTASTAYDAPYLSIHQSTFQKEAPIEFLVGDAKVSQVSVRGNTATFIEDARLMTVRDDAGKNANLPVDYLMWEENGQFFLIDATKLTQKEMIRIAESLQ